MYSYGLCWLFTDLKRGFIVAYCELVGSNEGIDRGQEYRPRKVSFSMPD